jgi:DNA-binding response OmpR family regulator
MAKQVKSTRTILLVDDERAQRESVRKILRREGYKVVEAANYNEALAVFRSYVKEIVLLLSDVALPDGNGCDLAVALQNEKPDVRVLFVSGGVGSEVCQYYGLDLADIHFLGKPIQTAELVSRVARVLCAEPVAFPRIQSPKTFSASGAFTSD